MKLFKFILFFSVFIISCGPEKSVIPETKGPYFWQAEKNNKSLHILGTMHLGVSLEDLQCSDQIISHLQSSDLLFTETDKNMASVFSYETLPQSVKDETGNSYRALNETSQQFFREKIGEANNNFSYYGFLYILHSICASQHPNLLQEFNLITTRFLDGQIQDKAQFYGIKQNTLDSLPANKLLWGLNTQSVSAKTVEEFISDYDKICSKENLKKMLQHLSLMAKGFLAGDFLTLEDQGVHEDTPIPGYPPMNDDAIFQTMQSRNEEWLRKLLSSHANHENIFVAGGLSHFIESEYTSDTVLKDLKKAGFLIRRMDDKCMMR